MNDERCKLEFNYNRIRSDANSHTCVCLHRACRSCFHHHHRWAEHCCMRSIHARRHLASHVLAVLVKKSFMLLSLTETLYSNCFQTQPALQGTLSGFDHVHNLILSKPQERVFSNVCSIRYPLGFLFPFENFPAACRSPRAYAIPARLYRMVFSKST